MFWGQEEALCLVVIKSDADAIRLYAYSMKQNSFREAKSLSASQEIHQVIRDCGFHSATGIYLDNTKPVHILSLCFLNLHFSNILTRMLMSTKWLLSFKFSDENFVMFISAMPSGVPKRLIFLYCYSQIVTFLSTSDKATLLNVSGKQLGLLSSSVQSTKTTSLVLQIRLWFQANACRHCKVMG